MMPIGVIIPIPLFISLQFCAPEFFPGMGKPPPVRAIMPVPKTAIYEYDLFPLGEDQIGRTGQFFYMQPVSIPQGVDKAADGQFGPGILAFHLAHQAASFQRG